MGERFVLYCTWGARSRGYKQVRERERVPGLGSRCGVCYLVCVRGVTTCVGLCGSVLLLSSNETFPSLL